LNTSSPDFEKNLADAIKEFNPTICFDALGGDAPAKILKAMPPKTHLVCYGALAGAVLNGFGLGDLTQGKVIRGFNLGVIGRSMTPEQFATLSLTI